MSQQHTHALRKNNKVTFRRWAVPARGLLVILRGLYPACCFFRARDCSWLKRDLFYVRQEIPRLAFQFCRSRRRLKNSKNFC